MPTHADGRPLKITFGEMRAMGLRGVLVYCVNLLIVWQVLAPVWR